MMSLKPLDIDADKGAALKAELVVARVGLKAWSRRGGKVITLRVAHSGK
jgi:hypothetical protein